MSAETPTRIILDEFRYEDGFLHGYQKRDEELAAEDDPVTREAKRCTPARLDSLLDRVWLIAPYDFPEPEVGVFDVEDF